ncbi:MAG TPA: methyltransferase domain-containing protein [Rhizomicrobium sp.]|nr:methyltransferase domain-containing protein [Rhizomicrobium sp.]
MSGPPRIFDRALYTRRRARAAGTEFLLGDAAAHLAARIAAVNRRFQNALDLSSRTESFSQLCSSARNWTRTTLSPGAGNIVAKEEALPFATGPFDLITSVLSLHAVNDLPGALLQIRQALQPDGLFMAALFGGESLHELREAFAVGEMEISSGVTPRVAPFADVRDMGALLQRAGFALPVSDVERTTVHYRNFSSLVADLRALGETNALDQRSRRFLRRDVLSLTLMHYEQGHAASDGRLKATFDIVYLTGWAPHESQQKPLAPGSARVPLADALRNRGFPRTS